MDTTRGFDVLRGFELELQIMLAAMQGLIVLNDMYIYVLLHSNWLYMGASRV